LGAQSIACWRLPAVDQRWVRNQRGFESPGRYALALTQRLAIRRAKQRKAPAVVLFEDDVVLHPQFHEILAKIELPDDWDILYFGCAHTSRPAPTAPGLVRCRFALDTHAIAIRSTCYDRVISALKGCPRAAPGEVAASDWLLAHLHCELAAYAIFPNIAWQAAARSDLLNRFCTNYDPHGRQLHSRYATLGLAAESRGALRHPAAFAGEEDPAPADPAPADPALADPAAPPFHPAFMFLTSGNLNQGRMWREYLPSDPDKFGVYCHPKFADRVDDPVLGSAVIKAHVATHWGTISLVRASLLMIRAALADVRHTHFILLSESCVPIKPYGFLAKALTIDPRSVAGYEPYSETELTDPRKVARARHTPLIPRENVFFHSQWMILTREAAQAVTEVDFTSEFENMFAPDELYFLTALAMTGYPVQQRFRNSDPTWNHWTRGSSHPGSFGTVSPGFAADLLLSPSFFARKFTAESNIGTFGIHLAIESGGEPQ